MKKALFLLLTVAFIAACHKDNNCSPAKGNVEYLIVGYSSCFCLDCCKTGYKITASELFQGEKDNQGVYTFQSTPLPASKYDVAKILRDELPAELLNENGKTYFCGGCADQPVFYVELKKDNVVYHWQIDSQTDGFPDYVKTYSAKISDVLFNLQ